MAKHDYNNIRAPLWNAAHVQSHGENRIVEELFKFIEEWYYNYKVVCEEFDLYHKVPVNGVIPVGCCDNGIESYQHGFHKVDFFSVNFFEKILQKTCIFEKIVSPVDNFNYNYAADFYGQNRYTMQQPPSKLCIMSERFILSRESSDTNRVWTLDTEMVNNQSPQQGLALSLIATLMNNYIPLSLYKRNKHFRNFIEDVVSKRTQFDFRLDSVEQYLLCTGVELRSVPFYTVFRYGQWLEESVVVAHDFCHTGSKFTYKHLDELLGKNRKERLTEEDLQLYSICNEGRKPFIFDWEFVV